MAEPSTDPVAAIDLPAPGRERLVHLVRRWWRSRGRFTGLRYWLPFKGLPLALLYGILFAASGLTIGWRTAYDVSVQITSPADTRVPILAYVLSVAGWLLVPGLAGAVAGHVVSESLNLQRSRSVHEIFEEPKGG